LSLRPTAVAAFLLIAAAAPASGRGISLESPRPAERGEGGPERAKRVEGPGEGSESAIRKELREAEAANNLPRFDAAIERARSFIDTLPTGARRNAFRRAIHIATDISSVWHFEVSDPNGLYYDDERLPFFYERLAAEYPAYPHFIEDYRVIDRSGLPHYASRETRKFLLNLLENNGRKSP